MGTTEIPLTMDISEYLLITTLSKGRYQRVEISILPQHLESRHVWHPKEPGELKGNIVCFSLKHPNLRDDLKIEASVPGINIPSPFSDTDFVKEYIIQPIRRAVLREIDVVIDLLYSFRLWKNDLMWGPKFTSDWRELLSYEVNGDHEIGNLEYRIPASSFIRQEHQRAVRAIERFKRYPMRDQGRPGQILNETSKSIVRDEDLSYHIVGETLREAAEAVIEIHRLSDSVHALMYNEFFRHHIDNHTKAFNNNNS